jgi:anaerobic magnesium-protoporphyrin IX monomethyl ester cyclase
MKLTFIIPNLAGGKHFLQPPLDVLYSIQNLRVKGHDCNFIDNRVQKLSLEELVKNIPKSEAYIINTAPYDFSQMYHFDYRLAYSIATAKKIKEMDSEKPLILTGIHLNVKPDEMIKNTHSDIGLLGEVDFSIVELIENISDEKKLLSTPNLILKIKNDIIYTKRDNQLAHPLLQELPLPAYDQINFNDYYGYKLVNDKFERINKWGIILGSRGCPYSCNFCHNFWGNNLRYRTVDSVVEEVIELDKKYRISNLFFLDPNFTLNKNWAINIAKKLKNENLNLNWSIQTRFDLVDEEILSSLSEGGCSHIFYGLESYNNDVLEKMNKKTNTSMIDNVIQLNKKYNVTAFMFIMLGVPGETKEGIMNTINFLKREELPYIAIVYGSRYGTEFQKQHQDYLNTNMDWKDLLDTKGIFDNEIDNLYLSKVVRYLRNQNVLRNK